MHPRHFLACIGWMVCAASPAFALDIEDEMMGTRANGRMERRDEGFDRVNDPRMDYQNEFKDAPRLGDALESPTQAAPTAREPREPAPGVTPHRTLSR